MKLVKYEAARAALEAATKIDEVKSIHGKAVAMAAYAKQAKDTDLINWAVEIKVRAERRAGELLKAMPDSKPGPKAKELGPKKVPNSTPALADLGISKNDSSTWQKLADIPAPVFEKKLIAVKAQGEKLTTKAVLAVSKPVKKDKEKPDIKLVVAEIIQKLSKQWPDWTKRIEILERISYVSEGLALFVKHSKDWTEAKRIQAFNTLCIELLENYKG